MNTRLVLRHLFVFQIKLLADALRDVALSPVALVAGVLDAVLKPPVEESFSYKLMLFGRRSDRVINLFDEFTETEDYTIDDTVRQFETAVQREIAKHRES